MSGRSLTLAWSNAISEEEALWAEVRPGHRLMDCPVGRSAAGRVCSGHGRELLAATSVRGWEGRGRAVGHESSG